MDRCHGLLMSRICQGLCPDGDFHGDEQEEIIRKYADAQEKKDEGDTDHEHDHVGEGKRLHISPIGDCVVVIDFG